MGTFLQDLEAMKEMYTQLRVLKQCRMGRKGGKQNS
jgi:hypothetical protein